MSDFSASQPESNQTLGVPIFRPCQEGARLRPLSEAQSCPPVWLGPNVACEGTRSARRASLIAAVLAGRAEVVARL
jgi:hypothetical protein